MLLKSIATKVMDGVEIGDGPSLVDKLIRWQAFLFFSNFRWLELLHEVYGADLSADSFRYTIGRTRIFDNIKAYKNKVLSCMEVSLISFLLFKPSSFLRPLGEDHID